MIPNLKYLLAGVEVKSTALALESWDHGPRHWRDVARVGIRLAEATPGADPELIFLFGLLHDTRRINEWHDPDHGRRAAEIVPQLLQAGLVQLEPTRAALLVQAIANHVEGVTTLEPTVGCCWDADRLTLGRVGVVPKLSYLSTHAAKDESTMAWADEVTRGQDQPWKSIHTSFGHGP